MITTYTLAEDEYKMHRSEFEQVIDNLSEGELMKLYDDLSDISLLTEHYSYDDDWSDYSKMPLANRILWLMESTILYDDPSPETARAMVNCMLKHIRAYKTKIGVALTLPMCA